VRGISPENSVLMSGVCDTYDVFVQNEESSLPMTRS